MTLRTGAAIPALLILLAALACAPRTSGPRSFPPPEPEAATIPPLPASYRMVHRVRLEVRGRSFDFIGYLAVRGESWRAVAYSELGGRLFDFLCLPPRREVLSAPQGLPRKPLREGVMSDLARVFAPGPSPPPPGRETDINVRALRRVEGWPAPVPERLTIVNRRWGYAMDVLLLRMDLRPVGEDAFREGEGRREEE